MQLWNWLLPSLFVGVREIDYMQALTRIILTDFACFRFAVHLEISARGTLIDVCGDDVIHVEHIPV